MGCGASKTEPEVEKPPEATALENDPLLELVQETYSFAQPNLEVVDIPDVVPVEPEVVRTVPELGIPIKHLLDLASELGPDATPQELLQKVVLPRARAGACRFAELDKQQVSKPTYYVKQQWTRSYKEMMSTIMQHIQAMEPNLEPEEVGLWLDVLCADQSSPAQRDEDMKSLAECLAGAKPTLVCMDHDQDADQRGVPPGALQPPGVSAGQLPGQRVCLIMYRSREGLRGFHLFDTVHIKYL